jgi:cytochrome c biogenesis protein
MELWANSIWKTLVSVRLTITLVATLTVFCIAGTLIAQQGTTQVPIESLYSPTALRWLNAFGLLDIFHSPLFIFVIFLLALNLISCSIERLPKVWKEAFHTPPPPVRDPVLKDWTPEEALKRKYILERVGHSIESGGRGKAVGFESVREAKMATLLFFQRHFKGYQLLRDNEDGFQVMLEKGKYSRLGVYVTHLSLLVIMLGGGLSRKVHVFLGWHILRGPMQGCGSLLRTALACQVSSVYLSK